jgi:nucleoside-diphosphate-sugar epimerase
VRILVAGSAGMIGSNVARLLDNPDLCDKKSGWDARDVRDRYDLIYDCASYTRGIGNEEFLETAQIPLNLAQQTKHLVYLSSSCVYPHYTPMPAMESWGFKDEPESTNLGYGWAKRVGEMACKYVKSTIARLPNVYGPSYDWSNPEKNVIPALIEKMQRGEDPLIVWGSGEQTRSFLYEEDCARILVRLSEHEGVFNLGGEETSIRELVTLLSEITEYKGKIVYDQSKPEGPKRKALDTSKLRAALVNWKVTPLKEGLAKTVYATARNYRYSQSAH